jgi:hypothetical protein
MFTSACPKCGSRPALILALATFAAGGWLCAIILGATLLALHAKPSSLLPSVQPSSRSEAAQPSRPVPAAPESKEKNSGLVLLEDTLKIKPDYLDWGVITGTVVNKSARTYGSVYIQFSGYNDNGALVGNASASVSQLEPGGRWEFKTSMKPEAKTIKFVQLSGR